jgi:hypothetical protein
MRVRCDEQVILTVLTVLFVVDHLAFADKVITLDGKGSLGERDNAPALADQQSLGDGSRAKKPSSDKGDSETATSKLSEDVARPSTNPGYPQLSKSPRDERQRGDFGLYRFYFTSIAMWQYVAWGFLVAIAVTWNQMPGKLPV